MKTKQRALLALLAAAVLLGAALWAVTRSNAKAEQADRMFAALVAHMRDATHIGRIDRHTIPLEVPSWLLSQSR